MPDVNTPDGVGYSDLKITGNGKVFVKIGDQARYYPRNQVRKIRR